MAAYFVIAAMMRPRVAASKPRLTRNGEMPTRACHAATRLGIFHLRHPGLDPGCRGGRRLPRRPVQPSKGHKREHLFSDSIHYELQYLELMQRIWVEGDERVART